MEESKEFVKELGRLKREEERELLSRDKLSKKKKEKIGEAVGGGVGSAMKTLGKTSGTLFEKMAIKKKPQKLANKMMFGMPPGFEKTYGERETYNSKGGIGPQDLVYTFGNKSEGNQSIMNPSTSFIFPSKMPTGVVEEEEIEPIPFYDEKTEVAMINKVPKRINPLRAEREVFSKDPIQEIFGMKVIR